jgi:hypothetical protein
MEKKVQLENTKILVKSGRCLSGIIPEIKKNTYGTNKVIEMIDMADM